MPSYAILFWRVTVCWFSWIRCAAGTSSLMDRSQKSRMNHWNSNNLMQHVQVQFNLWVHLSYLKSLSLNLNLLPDSTSKLLFFCPKPELWKMLTGQLNFLACTKIRNPWNTGFFSLALYGSPERKDPGDPFSIFRFIYCVLISWVS